MKNINIIRLAINSAVLFACTTLAFSCKKDKKEDEFSYTVNNVSQVTIDQNGTKAAAYAVQLISGTQQKVNLSISGLPTGITASLDPSTGIAPYNTIATFVANSTVAKGTYNFLVTATTDGQAAKTFNSTIVVTSACGSSFFGSMNSKETCTIGTDDYTSVISPATGIPNRINIDNFYNDNVRVYADFNCTTNTVIIPSQIVMGFTISGSGTIVSDNQFNLTFTLTDGTISNTCTTIYTK